MAADGRISTDGGQGLGQNPFAALGGATGPVLAKAPAQAGTAPGKPAGPLVGAKTMAAPAKNRGRVDIIRETGNRGGKTVTVITGFTGIGQPEKEQLAKKMRAACGCGGTVKEGRIEIQGDQRETVARILTEAGFRPVLAGG